MSTNKNISVVQSLEKIHRDELSIDIQSVNLCVRILQQYTDKLNPKIDADPVVPPGIRRGIISAE